MCLLRRVPLLLASLVAPSTTAKIIPVKSTVDAPFFDPTNTTAEVGDIVEFHFAAHNRSVVMGSFDHPCQPVATGGFFSGFFTENDTATENVSLWHQLIFILSLLPVQVFSEAANGLPPLSPLSSELLSTTPTPFSTTAPRTPSSLATTANKGWLA